VTTDVPEAAERIKALRRSASSAISPRHNAADESEKTKSIAYRLAKRKPIHVICILAVHPLILAFELPNYEITQLPDLFLIRVHSRNAATLLLYAPISGNLRRYSLAECCC